MAAHPVLVERRTDAWQRDYDRVARAIRWLAARRLEQPRLAEVADALALSPRQLQRTFVRFAGTTPTRLLRWLTLAGARQLLTRRVPVLEATQALGLSSPGRLHDLVVSLEALTPGELARGGAGVTLRTGVHPTPLGPVLLAVSSRGVAALHFLDAVAGPGAEGQRHAVHRRWPGARLVEDPDATAPVARRLVGALSGEGGGPPLSVAALGTNLQIRVWSALLEVGEGRVATYGDLAHLVGRPRAVRAVASAVGANPVGVLIPCHRVLRATGGLGGYRWGQVRKHALLAREAARLDERDGG